ncbi:MAG: carbohydrate binding domain-containing protein [Verrucomicrobia bacterium]|nr:carbohydrate binding domain-containing protein [Verrucomicrobiota bacterium]
MKLPAPLAWFSLALAVSAGLPAQTPAPLPVLQLDLQTPGAKVSPTLYGLMTEEINYSYDGGLYGELVRNRTFQDDPKKPAHWSPVVSSGAAGTLSLDETRPLNSALPVSLRLEVASASAAQRAGVANDGFWGIPIKSAVTYRASFYARASSGLAGPVTLALESDDGATVYAKADVSGLTTDWRPYAVTLTTGQLTPTTKARLVITVGQPGTVWLNLVSLFPPTYKDRPNGNRPDIMQILADMKPAFLRFPGGNYLEGDTIATRFDWKKSLGDLAGRPGHMGCWSYRSSDGLGLLEFLNWCEDLNMAPVLAVYAGYSLKGEHVPAGPGLKPFVQDALDEIEYVTGDTGTKWGAQRAKDGHPQPFKLTYVEIGNEDWFDKSGSYDGRYNQFYEAIKAKYPALQLIATAKVKSRVPDLLDEHYYRNAWQMETDAQHYDGYSRTGTKIFVGEWATREGAPTTNLNAALGDAAWMTGMERNSDVVLISCYAPLFVNVNPGGMQWKSNLIGYNGLTSYGSPSYYAQKMFNTHLGDTVVPIQADAVPTQTWQPAAPKNGKAPEPRQVPVLFTVATRDTAKGALYLKVVNTGASAQTLRIELKGATSVAPEGEVIVLTSEHPTDTNSITEPTKIVPVTAKISDVGRTFVHTFAPYSVNVLTLQAR